MSKLPTNKQNSNMQSRDFFNLFISDILKAIMLYYSFHTEEPFSNYYVIL